MNVCLFVCLFPVHVAIVVFVVVVVFNSLTDLAHRGGCGVGLVTPAL